MSDSEKQCINNIIKLYTNMPYLWDPSHVDYRNKDLRTYKGLINKLREIDPSPDHDAVLLEIQCLLASFRQQHRKVLMNKLQGMIYKPTLWYYNNLLFNIEAVTLFHESFENILQSNLQEKSFHVDKEESSDEAEYETEYLEDDLEDKIDLDCQVKVEDGPAEDAVTNDFEGVCQCCLNDVDLRGMLEPDFERGRMEVYAEMLHAVYPDFKFDGSNGIETQYLICSPCVEHLRTVTDFLEQVRSAQKVLNPVNDVDLSDSENIKHIIKINTPAKPQETTAPKGYDKDISYSPEKNSLNEDNGYTAERKHKKNLEAKYESDNGEGVKKAKRSPMGSGDRKKLNLRIRRDIFHNKLPNLKGVKEDKLRRKTPKTVLEKQSNLSPQDLTCVLCNITFTAYYRLCRHMAEHYPNYSCETCGRNFVTWNSLRSHIITIHNSKKVTCEVCKKVVKKTSLRRHMWTHTEGGYKYRCNVCPEVFSSHQSKVSHMVRQHGTERVKHKCQTCDKAFENSGTLSHHVKRMHLKVKNVKCDHCSMMFYSRSGLRRHMTKHTGERAHTCPICHKSYTTRNTLSQHMYIHSGIKRFVCGVCDRRFTYKCMLKMHMNVH